MDAATIEETNRIRVSLGMKPLPVPGAEAPSSTETKDADDGEAPSTVESRQAQAYDNYNKAMEAESAKKKRDERNAAIKKARENAQRLAKLEGKGLGEADEGNELDAKSWLLGQKKRQKKIDKARKIEEELAAAEAEAAAAVQYTSKDLAGIKIAHETSALLDGGEQILTLKDTTIEENEEDGDQLENVDLREQEKLVERLDLKKKRPGYNPNDDEDGETGILAQYDEEITGKQGKSFTLGENGMIGDIADILDQPAQAALGKHNVNLDDIVGDGPISSDYLAPSEIKVKKPKKKKKSKSRQKQIDDEDDILFKEPVAAENDSMDVDGSGPAASRKRKQEVDILDDDEDLQASLAAQRKLALKKRKKTRFEDLAKQLKEQEEDPLQDNTENGTGMVIGEISEFVSGLTKHEDDEEEEERRRKRRKQATTTPEAAEAAEDHEMEDAPTKSEQLATEEHETEIKGEEEDGTGIGEEKHISDGMGAALSLLRERGLIEESKGEDQIRLERQRQEFLHGKAALERELEEHALKQREYDRQHSKMEKMSTREREDYARHQNQRRDHQHAKKMVDLFQSTYKPTFELKYTDDHGRELNQKEAFKQLSHQFHGKGSGKGKTEKRLKKIEDEKRREAQSMFDATQQAGMSMATSQQLKKRKEAGVRLG